MDDIDLEMEDVAEEETGDERQNRTFIILVAIMGGLLLIGIVAFCVWVLVVGRNMLAGGQALPSPTDTPTVAMETPVVVPTTVAPTMPPPTEPPTTAPTARPTTAPPATAVRPPSTPAGAPAATPTTGAVQPVQQPTPLPPTATQPGVTTPAPTGLGGFALVILAAGLLFLLFLTRRLRTAASP